MSIFLDGTNIQNVLYTRDSKLLGTPALQENCEALTTCVKVGNTVHTKIVTDPKSEVVKISRVIDNPDGQITDCYKLAADTEWFGGPQLRYGKNELPNNFANYKVISNITL